MNFKDVIKADLKTTFHNNSEFAEKMSVFYDGSTFEASVLMDQSAMEERSGKDNASGIFKSSVYCFIMKEEFPEEPRRNHYISIGNTEYVIISVSDEVNEYALELEISDE